MASSSQMTWTSLHSKLCNITFVATKVHMILRRYVVLTWVRDSIEVV